MTRMSASRRKLFPAPYLSMMGETRKLLQYTTETFIANNGNVTYFSPTLSTEEAQSVQSLQSDS
jgi:hypothetical protein